MVPDPMRDGALPIDRCRADVEAAFGAGRPLVVEAPTGSGKSTRLPLWLADRIDGEVVVIEPRRVAARSLAAFVARQRAGGLGGEVGYSVRFDDRTGPDTRLTFMTPGVALRRLQAPPDRWPAAVVLDEFHERGLQTDLCAALMMQARAAGRWQGELVVTSATLDGQRLAERLGATRVVAEGRTFPVDVRYDEARGNPSLYELEAAVVRAVDDLEAAQDDGDILVFLPGKKQIASCRAALSGRAGWEALPLHAGLRPADIDKAFVPPRDRRRVFLATNVAETSVTLPWVRGVIDSGLVRQRVHRGGRSALALIATSQASMDQRAGRAGRTAPGTCVRLFSSRFRPEGAPRPEIERVELDDLLVASAAAGLNANDVATAPWVTPPPTFALQEARGRLSARGVLDADGALTDVGRALAELPVSAGVARALLDPPPGLEGLVADAIALVERDQDLMLPLRATGAREEDVEIARRELLGGCRSDLEAQVRCLRAAHPRELALHDAALGEVTKVATQLRGLIRAPTPSPRADGLPRASDVEALARHLLERLPEQAYVVRERARAPKKKARRRERDDEPWANGHEEIFLRALDEELSDGPPADAGLILSVTWLGQDKGRGVRGVGRLFLPCDRRWLADAGIGELTVGEVKVIKGRHGPRLAATAERVLAGQVLDRGETALVGDELLEHAAKAIVDGRLFKPAGERARDALHVLRTAKALGCLAGELLWSSPVELVRDRLATLGLTSGDELSLLGADDLDVDLIEAGVDPLELDRLVADFPRQWTFEAVVHDVAVEPGASPRVVLEVANRSKAKLKQPPAQMLPRFRGLPVMWKKASRTVKLR
jgi:ATP-dependent helicase HrpB